MRKALSASIDVVVCFPPDPVIPETASIPRTPCRLDRRSYLGKVAAFKAKMRHRGYGLDELTICGGINSVRVKKRITSSL